MMQKTLGFLLRRASIKKLLPDVVEPPGSRIDFSEDLESCPKREINEEFGMHEHKSWVFFANFSNNNDVSLLFKAKILIFGSYRKSAL